MEHQNDPTRILIGCGPRSGFHASLRERSLCKPSFRREYQNRIKRRVLKLLIVNSREEVSVGWPKNKVVNGFHGFGLRVYTIPSVILAWGGGGGLWCHHS